MDVAGLYGGGDAGLVAPGAAGFTAVPGDGELILGYEGRETYQ